MSNKKRVVRSKPVKKTDEQIAAEKQVEEQREAILKIQKRLQDLDTPFESAMSLGIGAELDEDDSLDCKISFTMDDGSREVATFYVFPMDLLRMAEAEKKGWQQGLNPDAATATEIYQNNLIFVQTIIDVRRGGWSNLRMKNRKEIYFFSDGIEPETEEERSRQSDKSMRRLAKWGFIVQDLNLFSQAAAGMYMNLSDLNFGNSSGPN